MRKLVFYSMIFSLVGTNFSCESERYLCPVGTLESMTFGHFYGECAGEGCVEMFKIDGGKLFEEGQDSYPTFEMYEFEKPELLSVSKYAIAKNLIDEIPAELFDETETVIGVPDGGDWGGIYVEVKYYAGFSGFWYLDQNENNMPEVYNEFVDKINETIALINQ